MNIFTVNNFTDNVCEVRDRCILIIMSSIPFGLNFIPIIKEECLKNDLGYPDKDDFMYLNLYAREHGKKLLLDTFVQNNKIKEMINKIKTEVENNNYCDCGIKQMIESEMEKLKG